MYIPTPQRLLEKAEATVEDMYNTARKLREGGNDCAANYILNAIQHQRKVIADLTSSIDCKRGK